MLLHPSETMHAHSKQYDVDIDRETVVAICYDWIPDSGRVCTNQHLWKNDWGIYDACVSTVRKWAATIQLSWTCTAMLAVDDWSQLQMYIIKFTWVNWFVPIVVSNSKVSPKCFGSPTGRIHNIIHEIPEFRKCVQDWSHSCWHWEWYNADCKCFRNFWRDINRKAMPLSSELSLATSYVSDNEVPADLLTC